MVKEGPQNKMSCVDNIELEELTIEWLHVSGDGYLSVPLIKVILFIAAPCHY
jgi:hypothetical protein